MPHPFWVLIYPLRFNLPMSGFSRLLIRLRGVDSNTKRAPTSRRTSRLILATLFTHMHGHMQPLRCWGKSPRLETRFGETVFISPPWASFTLCLLSAAPVNKTGRKRRKGEQKAIYSDRKRCWWWRHSSLNFFYFKSFCQVKAALSQIRLWQMLVFGDEIK